ncbi:hypothetical protein KUF71_016145, partial [Frankliniella fusca]
GWERSRRVRVRQPQHCSALLSTAQHAQAMGPRPRRCGGPGGLAQLLLLCLCLQLVVRSLAADNGWKRPGCHRVVYNPPPVSLALRAARCKCAGHTRKISIPDCVEFHITTNACRGFCESWSIPSALETLLVNPHQPVTSVGECCNIMDTEDVTVRVMCLNGFRELTFKSAKSCSCYHCKKD